MPSFRTLATCIALTLFLSTPALATDKQTVPSPSIPAQTEASQEGAALRGTVVETMNAAGYTYLQVEGAAGTNWVAIPESTVTKGQQVTCLPGMVMENFQSKTLDRTFPTIVFSPGLQPTEAQPAAPGVEAPPAPRAATSGQAPGEFSEALQAERTNQATVPSEAVGGTELKGESAGSLGAIVPSADVTVHKASGENSRSVGECFMQAKELNGKKVRVRGKVMKVSRLIMGKNWLHIQDGTGNPTKNQHDLVVTTMDAPAEGEVITIEGVLAANRDFGAGYKYAVIVEDAKVEK
ncbi:MAG: DNA-binding protein [Desulfobulbus sp.]|jgi:hypothetical protein|nr:DNA-binding protein [Desulfobulbus sp.]